MDIFSDFEPIVSRRSFLTVSAGTALAFIIPGCDQRGLSQSARLSAIQMSRLLYPHKALTDKTYESSLDHLFARAEADDELLNTLKEGTSELNEIVGGVWRTASKADQLESLKTIESEPFFKIIQDEVRKNLYELPEVWPLLGYEGPSAKLGGYLQRGFDDIDWLPNE